MIRLAANLSTMFSERPMIERFAWARSVGFSACEMQFPYEDAPERLAEAARAAGLEVALINAPAGDLAAGERGLALGGGESFERAIHRAIDTARQLGCPRVHVLVGRHQGPLADEILERAAANLRWAADAMGRHAIDLLLEALNPDDQPGYVLLSLAAAETLRIKVGRPNVRLLFDAYHAMRRGEDAAVAFSQYRLVIGHVQVSRPPDRSEPDDPTNADFLASLDASDYRGFVGCEYRPREATIGGLGWARSYGVHG